MPRIARLFAVCVALLIGLVIAIPARAVDPAPPASHPDAALYAADYGVSEAEATWRLSLQDDAGQLEEELLRGEATTFGGLWIQHKPTFRIVAAFTEAPEQTLAGYVSGSPLASLAEARLVSTSLKTLEAEALTLGAVEGDGAVPFNVRLNVQENGIDLLVVSSADLDRFVERFQAPLPSNYRIVPVPSLAEDTADIYGGLPTTECTTGFSVTDNESGETGIVTAAHCGAESYSGTNLPIRDSELGGSHDEEWLATPGYTDKNWILVGDSDIRVITARNYRITQSIGSYPCKQGKVTGWTCGELISKVFDPGAGYNATFMYLDGTYNLSSTGDSGGPVVNGNTAWGIAKGQVGWDMYYTALDYVEGGVTVRVRTSS